MSIFDVDLGQTLILHASAARTATGSTAGREGFRTASALRVQLDVTAVTSVSMVLTVEDSCDGTNWNVVDTFPAVTGVGRTVRNITDLFFDMLRVTYTVTGTSVTFSVLAQSA